MTATAITRWMATINLSEEPDPNTTKDLTYDIIWLLFFISPPYRKESNLSIRAIPRTHWFIISAAENCTHIELL